MPNCEASQSYLGNFIDQNEKVNMSGFNGITFNFSPIRNGNPYFEVRGYPNSYHFGFGFKIGSDEILLHSGGNETFKFYDLGYKFTNATSYPNYFIPLKHSLYHNETIGVGLCIESKTFVVVHNDTYETLQIDFPNNSKVLPVIRETKSPNVWDIVSFNFGTKYPFEYNFPGFSPFCLAEHLCMPTCKASYFIPFNIALIEIIILI